MAALGLVWPNQKSCGTHVNMSGAGVAEDRAESRQRGAVPRVSRERCGAGLLRRRQQRVAGRAGRQASTTRRSTSLGTFKVDTLRIAALGDEPAAGAEDVRPRRLALSRGGASGPASPLGAAPAPARPTSRAAICAQSTISGSSPTATIASDAVAASASRSSRRELIGLRRQRVEIEGPHHERRRQLLHHVDEHEQRGRQQRCATAAAACTRASVRAGAQPEAARGVVHAAA